MHHISASCSMKIAGKSEAVLCAFSLSVVVLTLLFFAPREAQAAAGDLDPRFGNGGVVQPRSRSGRGLLRTECLDQCERWSADADR